MKNFLTSRVHIHTHSIFCTLIKLNQNHVNSTLYVWTGPYRLKPKNFNKTNSTTYKPISYTM